MGRKKNKLPNINTFAKGLLRRGTFSWKPRNEALKLARIDRGKYKCADCDEIFSAKEIQLDHIQPVIDPKVGFIGFDEYIKRLFPPVEGWACLCLSCHEAKTLREDALREIYKKERKELDKEDEDE